jgi:ABC-2 type transport system ATP-binding protein
VRDEIPGLPTRGPGESGQCGGDEQALADLWDVLGQTQARGKTIVSTTHHLNEAEALWHRVAIMNHSRILTIGSPGELVRGMNVHTWMSPPAGVLDVNAARGLPGANSVI